MNARRPRILSGGPVPARLRAVLLAGIAAASAAGAADDSRTAGEITHLLDYVDGSGCAFIRNGETHAAADARDHLAMKYGRASARVGSAEQFIDRVATRSFLSGDLYRVQCPGRPAQPTGPWLAAELTRWRAARR